MTIRHAEHDVIRATVFEHASDPAYVIDPACDRIVAVNDAACAMLGSPREELLEPPTTACPPPCRLPWPRLQT